MQLGPSVLVECVLSESYKIFCVSARFRGSIRSSIIFKKILTVFVGGAILHSSLPHEVVGICTPEYKGQKRPLLTVVFLCPSKSNTGLIRIKSIMVDCFRQLSSWPAPLSGSANLMQSASNNFALILGGLQSYKGVSAMLKSHTQNLAISSQVNPKIKQYQKKNNGLKKAVFNLVATNKILFKDLALPEALALFLSHPQARIKFSRMEGLK